MLFIFIEYVVFQLQKLRNTAITRANSACLPMRGPAGTKYTSVDKGEERKGGHGIPKVSMVPLIFLIFYEVSGGPFGIEDSVKAAGPLLAIVGFLLFAFIWSIPETLITAEMGTMFPENGGYVVWVSSALGPFWGFQQG
jgi:hypothetical protein